MKILVDTSVLIDVLRNLNRRRELLARLVASDHTLITSAINIAELYAGMRPSEEAATEALLAGMICVGLSDGIARTAGKLKSSWARRGKTLTLVDTLIAATAIGEQCVLLTDNQKDFPMPELSLYPL